MIAIKKVLDKVLSWAAIALFAFLVVVVVFQVADRFIFKTGQAYTEELARYTFVWLAMVSIGLVFSERGHVMVDFVVRKFPEGGRKAISVVVELIIMAFTGILLVWGGYRAAMGAIDQNLASMPQFTVGGMYMVMPVVGVIILIFSVIHLYENITGKVDPYDIADEVDQAIADVEADATLKAATTKSSEEGKA